MFCHLFCDINIGIGVSGSAHFIFQRRQNSISKNNFEKIVHKYCNRVDIREDEIILYYKNLYEIDSKKMFGKYHRIMRLLGSSDDTIFDNMSSDEQIQLHGLIITLQNKLRKGLKIFNNFDQNTNHLLSSVDNNNSKKISYNKYSYGQGRFSYMDQNIDDLPYLDSLNGNITVDMQNDQLFGLNKNFIYLQDKKKFKLKAKQSKKIMTIKNNFSSNSPYSDFILKLRSKKSQEQKNDFDADIVLVSDNYEKSENSNIIIDNIVSSNVYKNFMKLQDIIYITSDHIDEFINYDFNKSNLNNEIVKYLISTSCKHAKISNNTYDNFYYKISSEELEDLNNIDNNNKNNILQYIYYYGLPSKEKNIETFFPKKYQQIDGFTESFISAFSAISLLFEANTKGATKRLGNFLVPVDYVSVFLIIDLYFFHGKSITSSRVYREKNQIFKMTFGTKGRYIGAHINIDFLHMIGRIYMIYLGNGIKDILYMLLAIFSLFVGVGLNISWRNKIFLIISIVWWPTLQISLSIKLYALKKIEIKNYGINNPVYIQEVNNLS